MIWLDHAEARKDQDVDFRVAEEPEQMLEQQRIAAAFGREERGAEIAVGEQHGDRAREHGQRQQQQEHRDQDRPHEQRHLVQRHAGCAHVEDRGDEVDGAKDRRGAGQMDRQDREIHRRSGMAGCGQRRVERPARADAVGTRLALKEHRRQQQRKRSRQQPERDVVHARERHVGCPDHQRHDPVAEPADHRRHDHEEDHDQAVRGGEHIVDVRAVLAGEDLNARMHQLHPDGDRHRTADATRDDCEHQVHRADVLVVRRIDIAAPPGGGVVVVVRLVRAVSRCRRSHVAIVLDVLKPCCRPLFRLRAGRSRPRSRLRRCAHISSSRPRSMPRRPARSRRAPRSA